MKTIEHYRQSLVTDNFRHFDYGESGNMKIYKRSQPPIYDIKNIRVPISLIYAKNDLVADTKVSYYFSNEINV